MSRQLPRPFFFLTGLALLVALACPAWATQEQAHCEQRIARGDTPSTEGEKKGFGRYNVSALQVETYTGEPAVLYLGWTKEDGDWKVFAYKVVDP